MNNLRSKLIRLAYREPELRKDILPLLGGTSGIRRTASDAEKLFKGLDREIKQMLVKQTAGENPKKETFKKTVINILSAFNESFEDEETGETVEGLLDDKIGRAYV